MPAIRQTLVASPAWPLASVAPPRPLPTVASRWTSWPGTWVSPWSGLPSTASHRCCSTSARAERWGGPAGRCVISLQSVVLTRCRLSLFVCLSGCLCLPCSLSRPFPPSIALVDRSVFFQVGWWWRPSIVRV